MIRRRRRTHLLRRLLLLFFIINSISFTLYFLLSPPPPSPHTHTHTHTHHHPLKPWPILPSSLPWIPSSAPFQSCEAHFGNGFTRRLHLLRPISDGKGGFFRCLHSQTLNSSVCEMGMVRMDPARIRMSVGGEAVESVIGRSEEEELPVFGEGAFVVDGGGGEGRRVVDGEILERFAPKGDVERHTMRELMESVRVGVIDCGQWIEEPTLLVTRFEYANLFHTITDWYSAYVSSRVTNLTGRPHLVFVDGHCKAPLEETWEALFSSVRYAKSFTSPVCFRHVILSPLGYETALFKGLSETIKCQGGLANDLLESPNYLKTARLTEFGEMLRAAFDLPKDEHHILKPASGHNVLFIRREDYLAHPRHNGKVESRLSNEEEVYDALKIWASDHSKCKVNLVNGRFAHMKMKEQLRVIQEASVIIGAHGAGLTHIISASSNAVVLEIISSHYRRPHFKLISQWRGLKYHAINLKGSYVKPSKVIDELSNIMRNLGC